MPEDRLSHVDDEGDARMVDVSGKPETARVARATARLRMKDSTRQAIVEHRGPKGAVFSVARVAGILAAKRTSELIPLCHPLPLAKVDVDFAWQDADAGEAVLEIACEAKVEARTGVEMEALTAAAIAALTVYDMVKAIDRGLTIEAVRLEEKRGGKSGEWRR